LVQDPAYSTKMKGETHGNATAVDRHGNVVVAGEARGGEGLATPGVLQGHIRGQGDGYIAKYSAAGRLLWFTYIGGSNDDWIKDVDIDATDRIAFTGVTQSTDFPVSHAFQPRTSPTRSTFKQEGFVGLLDADGRHLAFSSYLGSPAADKGLRVTVGRTGDVTVLGEDLYLQESVNGEPQITGDHLITATKGAYQAATPLNFVARISPSGQLRWLAGIGLTRFLPPAYTLPPGWTSADTAFGAYGLAVDAAGNAYVLAETTSRFVAITPGAYQSRKKAGYDFHVTRLSADGRAVTAATYLGGAGNEKVGNTDGSTSRGDLALTSRGLVVYGTTTSLDFPGAGISKASCSPTRGGGMPDLIVARFDVNAQRLGKVDCLGGALRESAASMSTDRFGNVYVVGATASPDFPDQRGWQTYAGPEDSSATDCLVAKFAAGGGLAWSSALGGHYYDFCDGEMGAGIAIDEASGDVVVSGETQSPDFPGVSVITGARTFSPRPVSAAFLTKIRQP
jgi:hypothetical protein